DFIVPENAMGDVQEMRFCTYRMHLSPRELNLKARINNWQVDDTQASDASSLVRNARLHTSGTTMGTSGDNKNDVQIGLTFAYFDIDEDGIDEHLEIIWNMTSGGILKAMYSRYDRRPFVVKPYQQRAHLVYGQGVMEMELPYQAEATAIINNHIWNMMIANTKMYQGPATLLDRSASIYPGKIWQTETGEKIEPIDMGENNPTAIQAVATILTLGDQRTGVQSLNAPVRASSRTPATSMMSMQAQANRRFTHPFNNMKNGAAEAAIECV